MRTGFKVCDAMTKKPVSVTPDTTLKECAKIMAENHVGALLIHSDNKIQGIITEQDIVRKSMAKGMNPLKVKVSEIMEPNVISVEPEKDIYEALVKMRDLNIRHLPVLNDNEIIGLLTLKDILKIEPALFELLVERFELREEDQKPIFGSWDKEGVCELCGEYTKNISQINNSSVCPNCKKNV